MNDKKYGKTWWLMPGGQLKMQSANLRTSKLYTGIINTPVTLQKWDLEMIISVWSVKRNKVLFIYLIWECCFVSPFCKRVIKNFGESLRKPLPVSPAVWKSQTKLDFVERFKLMMDIASFESLIARTNKDYEVSFL